MSRLVALTHLPSLKMQACERTFIPHQPIDVGLAQRQFQDYCQALAHCGCTVHTFDFNRELPDCAFIEDTAVILDEVAVIARMGTAARRAEPAGVAAQLTEYRPVVSIAAPATLEGGDVLRVDRRLLVGESCRTNAAGIEALNTVVTPYGYHVRAVPVRHCLHLKTACTALPDGHLLVNPAWIDGAQLEGFTSIRVPPEEPWGANVLVIDQTVLLPAAHVRTAELLSGHGLRVCPVEMSEFAKAEAGVTCLSLLLRA